MKKIFLNCILKNNLGDDLFIVIVANRYKNHKFYAINYQNAKLQPSIENLKIIHINNFPYRFVRKICRKLLHARCFFDTLAMKNKDLIVCLGGSVFMEKKNQTWQKTFDWYHRISKKYYIIGANIGPVYTQNYLDRIDNEIFKNAEDVCLRDKKSKSYSKSENVRYAPDILFSPDYSKYIKKEPKKEVIVSVIKCEKKSAQMKYFNVEKYREKLIELIENFQSNGYSIKLFSFCEKEGDEAEIETIMSMLSSREKVNTYFYKGNYKEALHILGNAEIIIGSRFHSVVIGLAMGKKVIPVIYNDKTRNLLNDLNFHGAYIDIEQNIYPNCEELMKNPSLPLVKIRKIQQEALRQFKKLDEELK